VTPVEVTPALEMEAKLPVLYDALRRIGTFLAKAERLKLDPPEEVLASIRQTAHLACEACDDLTQAEFLQGMSLSDEEVLEQMAIAGYQFLSPTAKLRALGALKRQGRDERKLEIVR